MYLALCIVHDCWHVGGKQGEQAEIGERVSQLQRSMQEEAATAARKIAEEHSGK